MTGSVTHSVTAGFSLVQAQRESAARTDANKILLLIIFIFILNLQIYKKFQDYTFVSQNAHLMTPESVL